MYQSIQRKNAHSSSLDNLSTPFENYCIMSNEQKLSVLFGEINRIRSDMADAHELWNLEGLSESLKMLADWTYDSIQAIKSNNTERM